MIICMTLHWNDIVMIVVWYSTDELAELLYCNDM